MQVGVRRRPATPTPNIIRLRVGLAESIPGLRPAGQPSAVQNRSRRFCRYAHPNLHAYSCIETPRSHRTLKTPDSSVAPSPCGRGLGLMFPLLFIVELPTVDKGNG